MIKNFFSGTASFCVEDCDFLLLNRLRIYRVRQVSFDADVGRLEFTVPLQFVPQVKLVLARRKYDVRVNKNFLGLLNVFYARIALSAAAIAGVVAFFVLGGFVFNVRIIGVQGEQAAEVASFVHALGARPLTHKSGERAAEIAGEIIGNFDFVAHASSKIVGNTLIFNVYSVSVADVTGGGDIIAAHDGIITNVIVASGRALVKTGDIVRAGQTLIRGERQIGGIDVGMDEFGKLIQDPIYAPTRAVGAVYADVKYSEFGINTTADELLAKIVIRTGITNFDKVETFSAAPGVLEVVATVNFEIGKSGKT